MDISKAYPQDASIEKWNRHIGLDRKNKTVEVKDDYKLSEVKEELQFSLMTPCDVVIENNQLHLTGGVNQEYPVDLKVQFDPELTPKVELINLTDARLKSVWGDRLYRILLIKKALL